MAKAPKLKVFRTPIGFHDAYVAAPSQKAALEAWGSDHDLFARGVAERVEDPELTREPLEHPGTVIRRLRGTTAEQIAALPEDKPSARRSPPEGDTAAPARPARAAKAAPKPKPRPDRAPVREAEEALAEAEARHADAQAELARREAALARERRALEKQQSAEQARLACRLDEARDRYDRAIREWRG
jgi:hypothetical protein